VHFDQTINYCSFFFFIQIGFLEDIKCTDNDKMNGFTIEFLFAENPFFTNRSLIKTYEVQSLLTNEEPVLEKVIGTEIDWKKGKNLAFEEKQKKQRAKKGKNKGTVRYVTEKVKVPSFFHFFTSVDVDKLSHGDIDDAEAEEMMERLNMDYTVASLLRTEIIPQAVLCYTGELQDSDDEDDDEDFDEEDDEEDLEEDSGDDDEEDEEDFRGKKKGGKRGKGGKGGAGGKGKGGGGKGGGGKGGGKSPFAPAPGDAENPECKQS
jgi:nucleosome assembly protein 1-like 1